jgi:hypothetical protein
MDAELRSIRWLAWTLAIVLLAVPCAVAADRVLAHDDRSDPSRTLVALAYRQIVEWTHGSAPLISCPVEEDPSLQEVRALCESRPHDRRVMMSVGPDRQFGTDDDVEVR